MELVIHIKMDLALNNLQRLKCHKTQSTNHSGRLFSFPCPSLENISYIKLLFQINSSHKQHFPTDSYLWTHQCWPTSKNLHLSALCGCWIDLPRAMWPIVIDDKRELRVLVVDSLSVNRWLLRKVPPLHYRIN